MKTIGGLLAKAGISILALGGLVSTGHTDFVIANENIAIGIDEFTNPGDLLAVFDGVGGLLNTGGPHDFWADGFGGGFARTTMVVRNGSGGTIAIRTHTSQWTVPPTITHQTEVGSDSAIIEGEPIAGLSYRRIVRLDAGTRFARVTDTFRNDTGAIVNPGVLDNVNPVSPSTTSTFNDLTSVLGINDFASASIAFANTLTVGFGSDSTAFRFSAGGSQFVTNPFTILILDPNGSVGDGTLQSASNFGFMLPGQEFSFTWYIAFGNDRSDATGVYIAATGASVFEIGPVGTQNIDEHTEMVVPVPINNPGGGSVNWTVTGPAGMTIDSGGVVRWTPGELDGGNSYPVEVQADNGTSTATTNFTVNAIETNTPPVITDHTDQNVDEGGIISADFDATDSDIPVQTLTFSLVSGPAGATMNSVTGVFEWTTDEADGPGTFPVTVRVTDNGDGLFFDETTFNVVVAEVNLAPTVGAISDQTVTAGATLSLTATATDPDVPANTLTFSLDAGAPAGATIDPQSGAFSWTPGSADIGDHLITVRVNDGGDPELSDTEDFNVHVDAPSLNAEYTGEHSGEYSDPTTLSMRVTDDLGNPISGLSIDFALGTYVGSDITDGNGVAEVTLILDQAAGSPGVTISFAGNGTYDPFSRNEAYEIVREKVIVEYYGDTHVVVASHKIDRGAIRFYASAHQEDDGYPGDFTGAALLYQGFEPGNPGPTPDVEAGPVPVGPDGRAVTFKSVSTGDYEFYVTMATNDYWRVMPDVQFSLKVAPTNSLLEVTGSGWVPFGVGNGHGTYQFKVGKDKKIETGTSSFSYVSSDGYQYLIRVTSWLPGALIFGSGSHSWQSAFTGYASVTKTNIMTGQSTFFQDMPVTFDAWDGARAPNKVDAYGMLLLDAQGLVWLETPILNVGGGNIKIQ